MHPSGITQSVGSGIRCCSCGNWPTIAQVEMLWSMA